MSVGLLIQSDSVCIIQKYDKVWHDGSLALSINSHQTKWNATHQTNAKMFRKQTLPLLLFLASSLQSIITSSGSSLSTRWRGSSLLSPSPSLEQRRRVATSPSLCEYCITSHQAYIMSRLLYAQWTDSLTHAMCSWALSSVKKESTLGEQLTHMETTGAAAWKRTINGDDGVNNLLKTLFPDECVSKSLRGNLMCWPALVVDHQEAFCFVIEKRDSLLQNVIIELCLLCFCVFPFKL